MKKKLFKAMLPTISLLLVAVMSLTGVTYAWFTTGKTATVETFDVNVKTVDGILISLSGYNGTWGSYIDPRTAPTTTNGVVSTISESLPLRDVSSPGTLVTDTTDANYGKLIFYTGAYEEYKKVLTGTEDVTGQPTSTPASGSATESNYVYFEFYIKNEGEQAKNINLAGSTVTGSALSRAANRVAFVDLGSAVAKAVLNDDTAPVVTGPKSVLGIWEPNSKQHSPDGVAYINANSLGNPEDTVPYKAVNVEVSGEAGLYDPVDGYNYLVAATYPAYSAASFDGYYFIGDNGFRQLTADDYFQVVPFATANSALASLQDTNPDNNVFVYTKETTGFEPISATSTVTQGTTYYQLKSSITTYTKATTGNILTGNMSVKYDANLTDTWITVNANTIVKIGVYVWIEGQDADTTNYVAGNPFSVSIKLNKVDPAP